MGDKSQEFVTDFIEIYHNNPSLWNTKGKSYNDRNLKQKGYIKLLKLYKTVNEKATINTVKKKINNLRCSFRKELKKKILSKDNLYAPSLWYYDLLLFTVNQEPRVSPLENDDEYYNTIRNEESENTEYQDIKLDFDEFSSIPNIIPSENDDIQRPSSSTSITTQDSLYSVNISEANKSKRDDLLRIIGQQLQRREDEFEITGKYIANKLRSLPKETKIFAEKLVMDILFEAQLGTLNRQSKILI